MEQFIGRVYTQCALGEEKPRGIAVAVNSELVRKDEWPTAELAEGDSVEVLHAVAGG